MGLPKLFQKKKSTPARPELVSRRDHRRSNLMIGRTIGEKREKLETASERAAARKKAKKTKVIRIVSTIFGFVVLTIILILLIKIFSSSKEPAIDAPSQETLSPTIEIIDEGDIAKNGISGRMKTFVARAERDLRELGYTPTKAVIPVDSIREVDLYLESPDIYVKMIIDREPSVSAEDADRAIRYLSGNGIGEYTYLDVRVEGKAYWK